MLELLLLYRAGYIYSLNVAADFADMIGESAGAQYRSKANEILEATKPHYGKYGDYIYECDVRPQDGAVIHSIATFGKCLSNSSRYWHCPSGQTILIVSR